MTAITAAEYAELTKDFGIVLTAAAGKPDFNVKTQGDMTIEGPLPCRRSAT